MTYRWWSWAFLGLLFGALPSARGIAEPVQFPAYASVSNLERYASEQDYAAAIADKAFRMERLAYASDRQVVLAYAYRPVDSRKKLPVIIFNRGSWTWPSFHAELVTMANRLARRGYLVVAPMYRGSGGAKGRDELGGADLADLFNLKSVIAGLPEADPDRLYLYGESRGGMMVYQAIRDGFPARAAAVFGAFTDLEAMLADPRWAEAGPTIWPELATDRSAIVNRRSAIKWADRISIPILIMHGAEDRLVKPEQSLRLATQLSTTGKPFQLIIVAGEGHNLAGRSVERDEWAIDWFMRH